jgi:hypothetical protein
MRHLSSGFLVPLLLTGALAACEPNHRADVADQNAIDNTSSAAGEARTANGALGRSRGERARVTTEHAVEVTADIGTKVTTDAVFRDRRDEVMTQGREHLTRFDAKLETLTARLGTVSQPSRLRAALDGVAVARPLAVAALDEIALATPETWEVRRRSAETTYATLEAAYDVAIYAAR